MSWWRKLLQRSGDAAWPWDAPVPEPAVEQIREIVSENADVPPREISAPILAAVPPSADTASTAVEDVSPAAPDGGEPGAFETVNKPAKMSASADEVPTKCAEPSPKPPAPTSIDMAVIRALVDAMPALRTDAAQAHREVRMRWRGTVSEFLLDETRHIDLEGAFRSGKTTAALWKVFNSCVAHPGICWLISRYSDGDTQSKLKPAWREVLRAGDVTPTWDPAAQCDTLPNGSKVFILGLKAQDQISRYGKLRGMTLAGAYVDQAEELPHDIFLELIGRLSQSGMPHQLLLTPNPPDENHWLTREFPEDQHIKDHKYLRVSIYDNAHNLPAETIQGLEAAYPTSHPKHRSAVLGQRGLNVTGEPVYGGDALKGLAPTFDRRLHVRALSVNPELQLCEAIDFGKHHPCVVWAQYTSYNQLLLLGGILGQNLYLEDFAPIVAQYRQQWFGSVPMVLTCCDPAGAHDNSQGVRNNGLKVLQDHGFSPRYKPNSNAPDVRLAMVERLAGYMRRLTPQGPALGVEANSARWLRISPDNTVSWPFIADAFEAGYVWDEHMVSVGSKQVRKPKKDGWYEHGMNCCEYLELNFGGVQASDEQVKRQVRATVAAAHRREQLDHDPFHWTKQHADVRGGYR